MKRTVIALSVTSLLLLLWYSNQEKKAENKHIEIIDSSKVKEENSTITNFDNTFQYKSIADLALPSYLPEATILKKHGFTIGYSKKYKNAHWVAYVLNCAETKGKIERTNYFKQDKNLGNYSPHSDDYNYSGYDRGHLIPAGDNTYDSLAMDDSFLMSNISPQIPGFNRGIWKTLEQNIRVWACLYDSLYIITGCVLNDGLEKIGKRKVSVPDYYFKSVLMYNVNKQTVVSFLMYQYTKDDDLAHHIVTTDSLEQILGLDLFYRLDDRIENKIESNKNKSDWLID